ncbi:unnamed protein product [Bursaphelenchus okinawaensis]|uniref:G_PROTEIN_RECEP_F1_2 domain-containing protein n=1 Tax=Bursaphelenchus okinawaensis TaxID=465554 RepID=A0A811KT69_9BILA|nr:unnamed protein product [Bursaphelenchus okinawaensis]CAG9111195.1 unnamed protein product [Bursaphelenchus okinawaensis]
MEREANMTKYVFFFFDHIAVAFIELKFFIFALERWYAIKNKGKEQHKGSVAFTILGGLALLVSIEIFFKTWLFWQFDTSEPIEHRLKKGLTVTTSVGFLAASYILYIGSVVAGVLLLKYTKGYIKKLRLQSESLAESFELSQSNRIADALRPMIILYVGCGLACAPTCVLCYIMVFCDNTPYLKKLFFVAGRLDYFNLSLYSLLSLVVGLNKFGIISKNVVLPTTDVIYNADSHINHFDLLADMWDVTKH